MNRESQRYLSFSKHATFLSVTNNGIYHQLTDRKWIVNIDICIYCEVAAATSRNLGFLNKLLSQEKSGRFFS